MRQLQFPVEWHAGGGERLLISVHTGPSHTAHEFIAYAFFTRPVGLFLDLLTDWRGLKDRYAVRAAGKRLLVFDIAHDLVDAPWQVASILALIESAIFLQDLEDDPFITGVTVRGQPFAEETTEGCFADMARFAGLCGAGLSDLLLSDGTQIEGEPLTQWPERAERCVFDIRIALTAPLGNKGEARLRTLFERIEVTLAGSAFETEHSAEDLIDEALVPFPTEFNTSDRAVHMRMESPPSNVAIPLTLLRETVRQRMHIIDRWNVGIAEAW